MARTDGSQSSTVGRTMLLAAALGLLAGGALAQDAAPRETVLVLDFADQTGRTEPGVGGRVADVLTRQLLASGRYVVVDPSRVREVIQQNDPGSWNLTYATSASTLGKMLGADKVVQGEIVSLTKRRNQFRPKTMDVVVDNEQTRLRVHGQVVDVATGTVVYTEEKEASHTETTGAATTVIDTGLVDELLEEALGQLAADISSANLAAVAVAGPTVSVTVDSKPQGADVIIDDQLIGTTPVRIRLPERAHNLKLRLAGYEPYTRTMQVRDGLSLTVPMHELPEAEVIREEKVIQRHDRIDIDIR